jgi:hypothetical protein
MLKKKNAFVGPYDLDILHARLKNSFAQNFLCDAQLQKTFMHKQNQLLAQKKIPHRISNHATKQKRCAQGFSAFDTK